MNYHCPVCNKVSSASLDLARHMIGRKDKVYRDWIHSRGFKYSELFALQFQSFGGDGYKALADLLEKETKAED